MKILYGWLISLLFLFAMQTFAANIQPINVYSALNQPFVADIPILGIDKDTFAHMQISLASVTEFEQEQITYFPFYAQLDLSKGFSANGAPIVRVTTNSIVTEPIFSLLIKFQFDHSAITRQFTVLLEPPTKYVTNGNQPQLPANIPVLTALDTAVNYATVIKPKRQSISDTDERPTPKLPLPTATELQASATASRNELNNELDAENQQLMLMQKLDKQAATELKHILPIWIDNQFKQQQIVIPQTATTALPEQSKPVLNKAVVLSENIKSNIVPTPPVLHKLPLVDKPKSSFTSDLSWLLLLVVIGGLVWRYKNRLPELLEKKLLTLKNHKAIKDNTKLLTITEKTASTQNGTAIQNHEGELDPLEESEVLYKYGRYEQAEAVLLAAVQAEAGRAELYLKLLEVYGAMNRLDDFENVIAKIAVEAHSGNIDFDTRVQHLRDKFFTKSKPKTVQAVTADSENSLAELTLKPEQFALLNEKQDDIDDKIRIAKACIEMQDYQSAKEILIELKGAGTVEQNEEIRQLLNKLPDNNTIEFKSEE